jgi:16S rRNA (cytosine967-C5)-methyltransferase
MSPQSTQLDALAEVIHELQPFTRPADLVLREFFRRTPQLGQRDRAFIAEAAFAWLRHKRSYEALASDTDPRHLALIAANRALGCSLRELGPALRKNEAAWLAEALERRPQLTPAEAADLPDWLYERLRETLGEEALEALANALHQAAPLDLRVNIAKQGRDTLAQALAAQGIETTPTAFSPWGLRVKGKPALQKTPEFVAGGFEVQDEGSQLIALLVAPARRQLVVDFCAGAGGKTLALAALMRNEGQVYAFDPVERRLRGLRQRLARAGQTNVQPWQIENESDPKLKRLAKRADRVLVDAPCSGFGTLRRNPDLKWRHDAAAIVELCQKQARILEAASALVKPGGRLIYATCSMLPEENRQQVAQFLAAHPEFRRLSAASLLAAAQVPLDTGEDLELSPSRQGCDGFYAAVLERVG